MKQGYYRLEHTYYSRGGNKHHGPSGAFHLSSVQNYDANIKKGEHVISVNLPDDRYELYAALLSHSNTITRKNGRMAERFILSHDVRISKVHRTEATIAFVERVTLGKKLKAYAYHHGQDTHNPHAHVQVLDVGADGKPHGHFGRSGTYRREHSPVKGNVTEWFRKEWETAQNEVLERHGYDFRVDRRSNLERGLEPGGKHRGPEIASSQVALPEAKSEIIVEPDMAIEPELVRQVEQSLHDHYVDKLSPEEQLIYDDTPPGITPQDWIHGALELNRNLQWLEATQQRIQTLRQDAEAAQEKAETYLKESRRQDLEADHHRNAVDLIKDELETVTNEDGTFKGFHVKFSLFGRTIDLATPTYRKAEALDGERQYQEYQQREARQLADRHLTDAQKEADKASELAERALASQRELDEAVSTYGDDTTLDDTREVMNAGIQQNLLHVSPEDIVAMHENGELTKDQAEEALKLMGAHEYIVRIELRDAQELEQEVSL